MSDSSDHDRLALEIAATTLRNLADDKLYSDAFRHRIMASIPRAGMGGMVQVFLLSAAARLEAMAARMAPPDTPAERLAKKRLARKADASRRDSLPD